MREPSEHFDAHAADARTVRSEGGGSRDPPPGIHHREHLGGSPLFSGPGGAGSWVRHRAWAERRAGGLPGEDEA